MSAKAWEVLLESGILEEWGWHDEEGNFVINPVDLPDFVLGAYNYLFLDRKGG